MVTLSLLSLFIKLTQSVMWDSGLQLNYWTDAACYQGETRSDTITFNTPFVNIPQIATFPMKYNVPAKSEFTFVLQNIQKTSFEYFVSCDYNKVNQFGFWWLAIDDDRIKIINSFNKNVSSLGSTTFTFTHNNPKVVKGFIIPLNFGFTDDFYWKFEIQSITSNQVVVSFTQNTTYLLSIGFQIVLAADESYLLEPPETIYDLVDLPEVIYINVPQKKGYELFIFTQSFNNPLQVYNKRFKYDINKDNNNDTVSYSVLTWETTHIASVTYQIVWMKVFQPFLLKRIRQTKIQTLDLEENYVTVKIISPTQSFTQPGTYIISLDFIKEINLQITFHCYSTLKITGSIFKCFTCSIQNYSWSQNCYSSINAIIYNIKLYQADYTNQQIQLTLNSQSVSIYQSDINNPRNTNYTVLNAALINK